MRRCLTSMLALSVVLAGCGKSDEPAGNTASSKTSGESGSSAKKGASGKAVTREVKDWGTVKGQVVFVGDVPTRAPVKVDKDKEACEAHGQLVDEKPYVVDKDTKGVRWAVVWLVDPDNPRAALPIKPELKDVNPKKVSIDQPTCQFEPHVLALRQGQDLEIKNSASISHNTKLDGGGQNADFNEIIPPKSHKDVSDFKASSTPIKVACTIHGWMGGYIRVFNHPYFAVTDEKGNFEIKDAPAGKWNLVVWQETKGDVNGKTGQPITIKPNDTVTEKVELKP